MIWDVASRSGMGWGRGREERSATCRKLHFTRKNITDQRAWLRTCSQSPLWPIRLPDQCRVLQRTASPSLEQRCNTGRRCFSMFSAWARPQKASAEFLEYLAALTQSSRSGIVDAYTWPPVQVHFSALNASRSSVKQPKLAFDALWTVWLVVFRAVTLNRQRGTNCSLITNTCVPLVWLARAHVDEERAALTYTDGRSCRMVFVLLRWSWSHAKEWSLLVHFKAVLFHVHIAHDNRNTEVKFNCISVSL